MKRWTKGLIAGGSLIIVAGMMFAATGRGVRRSSVLAPLNGMIARDRSELMEDRVTHSLYLVRMVQINNATSEDIKKKLDPDLKAKGYQQAFDFGGTSMYMTGGFTLGSSARIGMEDFLNVSEDKALRCVYVGDFHVASGYEIYSGRILKMGRRIRYIDEFQEGPAGFLAGH